MLDMMHVRFTLRNREAEVVRKYAGCCIDSSDGIFRALQDITGLSHAGFRIGNLPYNSQGVAACRLLGKPEEILFLGECGEYELVFTISPENEAAFLLESAEQHLKFSKLGHITGEQSLVLQDKSMITDLTGYSVFARNYEDVREYIREVVKFIENGSG
jgi:thiamine-monophosphate kinase